MATVYSLYGVLTLGGAALLVLGFLPERLKKDVVETADASVPAHRYRTVGFGTAKRFFRRIISSVAAKRISASGSNASDAKDAGSSLQGRSDRLL